MLGSVENGHSRLLHKKMSKYVSLNLSYYVTKKSFITYKTELVLLNPKLWNQVPSVSLEDSNPVENIDRLGDLMFQTSDKSQLLPEKSTVNQYTTDYCLKFKT